MEKFIKEQTSTLPKVILDAELGFFEFSGRSIPKNPDEFFYPIFEWFDKYLQEPNSDTNFIFNIEYLNTASHKCFAIIFQKLNKIVEGGNFVKVTWKYDEFDDDMYEMGKELEECCPDIPFEYLPYKEN